MTTQAALNFLLLGSVVALVVVLALYVIDKYEERP